jgi:2-phosphoglycerate kinase
MGVESGNPPWTVTLVCGASGVGKSSLARPLAARYGVPLGEADDVVTAMKALTTPAQFPALHYWDTHLEAGDWSAAKIADLHREVVEALRPGFEAVIADHLECAAPVVLEGDYLDPSLAAGHGGAVRAVVLAELNEDRIVENYARREPQWPEQRHRARVSVLLSAMLAESAHAVAMPVVAARPWHDGLDRVDRALRSWSP